MSNQLSRTTVAGDDREDIELPVWPFQDLRVASGMLLGTEDFHVMLGNPRGKMRLHQSWLHGSGVVWGLPVKVNEQDGLLEVGPGLAVDGWGRELRVEHQQCLSLHEWASKWLERHLAQAATAAPGTTERPCGCGPSRGSSEDTRQRDDCGKAGEASEPHQACVYVVVRADLCLDRLVPALADPCDTARSHNEESRVLELARVEIIDDPVAEWRPYPRLRALLGLDPDSPYAAPGGEAAQAAATVVNAPRDRRAATLLAQMRCLAAHDVTEVTPPLEPGTTHPGLFPVDFTAVPVVLAKLCLDVEEGGCARLREVDECVRRALLPSTTIQDLVFGDAPAVLSEDRASDAGGPRLEGDLAWDANKASFTFRLTAPAATGSEERAVEVSSLSERGKGWAREETRAISLSDDGTTVTVELEHPPSYALVRVIIRGTGRTPLYGRNPPVPFAGRAGGPPGTEDDGHDAVVTERFASLEPSTGEEMS